MIAVFPLSRSKRQHRLRNVTNASKRGNCSALLELCLQLRTSTAVAHGNLGGNRPGNVPETVGKVRRQVGVENAQKWVSLISPN